MELSLILAFLTTAGVFFVLGLAVAWLLLRYGVLLKPHVKISPWVLKGRHPTEADKIVYRIKVVNTGRRQVVDLLARARIQEVVERQRDTLRELNVASSINFLGGRQNFGAEWGIRPTFSFVITDADDLEAELTGNRRLVFILSVRDALSGMVIVQRVAYTAKDINVGEFKVGLGFDFEPSTHTPAAALALKQPEPLKAT